MLKTFLEKLLRRKTREILLFQPENRKRFQNRSYEVCLKFSIIEIECLMINIII